jgi:glycolate oxidase iron-sulfur subunit
VATEKVAWSPIGGFSGPVQPEDDDLSRCVHCGLCLNACPTYRATGLETESPRGRIYLMRAVKDGRMDMTEAFHEHMDLCLVCRSCETACPSGVPFGRLMERTRAQLWDRPVAPFPRRMIAHLAFERIMPNRRAFRLLFRLLQLYQRTGLQPLVRGSGVLERVSPELARQEALLPRLDAPFFDVAQEVPQRVPGTPRVGFVAGCAMSTAFGDVQRATVRVLERFGCQVVVPPGQGCCGALNVHAGERRRAKLMARALIESMLAADVDAVVINSAGCGSTMKEYHELFVDEPAYLPRVRAFEAKVRDLSEWLVSLPAFPCVFECAAPFTEETTIVYQDACHLRHAQRITSPPRQLLSAVPGARLVELAYPDQCCGSAGVYNLEHPDLSERILSPKIADIAATGATIVVSANPGCMMQIEKGLAEVGLTIPVRHLATVLDQALSGRTLEGEAA